MTDEDKERKNRIRDLEPNYHIKERGRNKTMNGERARTQHQLKEGVLNNICEKNE